jgi:prophage regulatory protein
MPSKPLLRAAARSLASRPSATESSRKPRKLPHQDQILRIAQVREIYPLSRPSLYRLIRAGKFPAPISLGGGRAVGWLRREIEEFVRERIEQRTSRVTAAKEAVAATADPAIMGAGPVEVA